MSVGPVVHPPSATKRSACENEILGLLREVIRIPSVSGNEAPLVEFVARWARARGVAVDVWQATEQELAAYPEAKARHIPLAGRPTCVLKVRGTDNGSARSLLMNAHTDVVAAGDEGKWTHGPFAGEVAGDRVYGRGACDTKGPMVSAIWALMMLAENPPAGDVMLELIPGEEDCVGLGTLTSVARGYRADGVVILEPTESLPRAASRAGLRFEITTLGKSVHGTVKWLGQDAIAGGQKLLGLLQTLETQYNDKHADELFASYPAARPLTVDTVRAGEWQGMIADRCLVAGYWDLLPGDDLNVWARRLESDLRTELGDSFTIAFPERYAGHRLEPTSGFCQAAEAAIGAIAWQGFNSGCEAGLRAGLQGSPTLVWGPGSLAQAHAPDEYVDFSDVKLVAEGLAGLARVWCTSKTSVSSVSESLADAKLSLAAANHSLELA